MYILHFKCTEFWLYAVLGPKVKSTQPEHLAYCTPCLWEMIDLGNSIQWWFSVRQSSESQEIFLDTAIFESIYFLHTLIF